MIFFDTLSFGYTKNIKDLKAGFDLALNTFQDVIALKNDEINIVMLGTITKKLKEINEKFILAYHFKENFIDPINERIGFVYNDDGNYIEFSFNLTSAFVLKESPEKAFDFEYISCVSESRKHKERDLKKAKEVIGEDTYELFVDLMLKRTNNKIKNAIYKTF